MIDIQLFFLSKCDTLVEMNIFINKCFFEYKIAALELC